MANILNIGTSALQTLQRAISTTGHNIANVNTEGFSRQRVDFGTLPPQLIGSGFIGTGVTTLGISRSYNEFLAADVRDRSSSAAGAQTLADLTGQVSNILADPSTGLGPALDQFFSAVQDVASNPGSLPERQVLMGQAEVLQDRFTYLNQQFQGLSDQANSRLDSAVDQINRFAQGIASLNDRIVLASNTGNEANDLLDARDRMLTQLSSVVGVNTVAQDDGAVNVFIGKGQSLVIGAKSSNLTTFQDPVDPTRRNIGFESATNPADIGQFLTGGEVGAVLSFRSGTLDSARSELGLIAAGVSESFNRQQSLGLDLDGNFGSAFFTTPEASVSIGRNNTGTAIVSAVIDSASELTGDRYELSFDGTDFELRNLDTNNSQTVAGPSFSVDGVTVSLSGTAAAGDSFLIAPVELAASKFDLAISDPRQIAAAAPLRSSATVSNAGTGGLAALAADDVTGLPLAGPVTLTFNPDAMGAGLPGFDVAGMSGGPIAYDPSSESAGKQVSLGDLSFRLEGVPVEGDSFGIQNNLDGSGDNRNALAMAQLQEKGTLIGETQSFQDVYSGLFTQVAVRGRQASASAETESALLQQAISTQNGSQGVNLDEEAANLLRYQQAYQAAAQVIAVADEVFQVLLNATAR